jgi:hypothetical protein
MKDRNTPIILPLNFFHEEEGLKSQNCRTEGCDGFVILCRSPKSKALINGAACLKCGQTYVFDTGLTGLELETELRGINKGTTDEKEDRL